MASLNKTLHLLFDGAKFVDHGSHMAQLVGHFLHA